MSVNNAPKYLFESTWIVAAADVLVLLVVHSAKLVCHAFLLPLPGRAIQILVAAHWPNLVVVVELPFWRYPRDRWDNFVVESTILKIGFMEQVTTSWKPGAVEGRNGPCETFTKL